MNDITPETLLQAMFNHQGEAQGVSCRDLAIEISGYSNAALERRIRSSIKALRTNGYRVCGTPDTGYFMAKTPDELNRTCKLLVDRAMSSLQQVAQMTRQALPDLYKQMRIDI